VSLGSLCTLKTWGPFVSLILTVTQVCLAEKNIQLPDFKNQTPGSCHLGLCPRPLGVCHPFLGCQKFVQECSREKHLMGAQLAGAARGPQGRACGPRCVSARTASGGGGAATCSGPLGSLEGTVYLPCDTAVSSFMLGGLSE
jgi:hypothetical protein